MKYVIDFNSDEALYLQLCNQIIRGIALQEIVDGEHLPSVRILAEEIGINMHTVNKAYTLLRERGYVKVDRRRGVCISINADRERALEETRENLQNVLVQAHCRRLTRKDIHALVDEIYDEHLSPKEADGSLLHGRD